MLEIQEKEFEKVPERQLHSCLMRGGGCYAEPSLILCLQYVAFSTMSNDLCVCVCVSSVQVCHCNDGTASVHH